MKRVLVLGCCGAGKSTFAKKLHKLTGLNLIHLDQHYWKADWVESEKEEWTQTVKRLSEGDEWIMDGNYSGTLDLRLPKADTIIYLDYPTWKCLWRVTKRVIQYRGTERPDMPKGCKERFDFDFFHYVAVFNLVRRKKLLGMLREVEGEKRVVVIRGDGEGEEFLRGCVI